MKLGLGTVQFGLDYGISNNVGKVSEIEVVSILEFAKEKGIKVIDTATSYGNSEEVLGRFPHISSFNIYSKTPLLKNLEGRLEEHIKESLSKLNVEKLKGLMVHHGHELLELKSKTILRDLMKLKEMGYIDKLGVSVYGPSELEALLNAIELDVVQIPFNIFDQRFLKSGLLKKCQDLGIEVHSRSAFLQGLLLMDSSSINPYFGFAKEFLSKYEKYISNNHYEKIAVALNFCLQQSLIDHVIVGVCSRKQLKQIIESIDTDSEFDMADVSSDDERLINPSLWRLT